MFVCRRVLLFIYNFNLLLVCGFESSASYHPRSLAVLKPETRSSGGDGSSASRVFTGAGGMGLRDDEGPGHGRATIVVVGLRALCHGNLC